MISKVRENDLGFERDTVLARCEGDRVLRCEGEN
jgi:hypothetical protein